MLTGQILLQIVVILIVVQLFGQLCKRFGQQWVIGEILAGLALGPSIIGGLWPGFKGLVFPTSTLPTLQTLGDISLVLYMFSLGACLETERMLRQSRVAIVISLSGILLPLLLGSFLAYFLYADFAGPKATKLSFILMVGTAMSITAFPVLARLLTEKGMLGTKIGMLALTCAAVDDVAAWCLLALVVAIIHDKSMFYALQTVGLTLLFIVGMLIIVRPLFALATRHIRSKQIITALMVIMVLLSAYCTNTIGIHPVFGAFLMGLILPRKDVLIEQVRSTEKINSLLFLPLFFVYSGLRTQIGLIHTSALWLICLLVLVIACLGKIVGGISGVLWVGKASWKEALSLGFLMNTRGLVELIVLNIGLDMGVLSPTIFSMLVIMALVTTMMASPLLSISRGKAKIQQGLSEETDFEAP